jgi:hypothetical protein
MTNRRGGVMSTKPAREKTTVNLPIDLKRAAQKLGIDLGVDLQDLIAEGLRLVLAKKGVRV